MSVLKKAFSLHQKIELMFDHIRTGRIYQQEIRSLMGTNVMGVLLYKLLK
jgi:hypothetical protein